MIRRLLDRIRSAIRRRRYRSLPAWHDLGHEMIIRTNERRRRSADATPEFARTGLPTPGRDDWFGRILRDWN